MGRFVPFGRALEDLGWPQVIDALAGLTATERGHARAGRLPFLDSRAEVEDSLACIEEARTLAREGEPLPMSAVADVGLALERADKGGSLAPEVILLTGEVIRAAARVRKFLLSRRNRVPRLGNIAGGLADMSGLAARIEASFEPSGELKDTASDALAGYRSRTRQLHRELKDRVEDMLHDSEFSLFVQDSYYSIRNDRYVLPIQASFRSQVPGIVHNASNSGQTLFVEPHQIVDLGNELSIAESLAAEEERQVLAEFSSYIGDRAADLADALDRLAVLDVITASGRLSDRLGAEPFEVAEGGGFAFQRVRHPLLVLQNKKVVANDVALTADRRALVVSGPNAGGKTVTITSVGLCVLMARAGLPVPALSSSRVPLFAGVCSAMGDAQDLSRDLSTFSAHLTALREILATAADGWLVVIDEIAADTDPKEGAALATATLEQLAAQGAVVLVTTHLDEVKALGVTDRRFENARVGFDTATLKPTYELAMGAAGVSNAIDIARQVGLPESVLERAQEQLETGGALSEALAKLSGEQRALEAEHAAAAAARVEVETLRAELDVERRELSEARRMVAETVRTEMAAEVDEARAEVGRLVAELQRQPKMARAQKVQKDLVARAEELDKKRARLAAERGVPEHAVDVQVGARVRVVSLNREGEVLAVDEDAATVAVGTLRSRVAFDELVVVAPPSRKKGKDGGGNRRKRRPDEVSAAPLEHAQVECDVRGMRADEATREVEAFLDRCSYAGPNVVLIIHGHGTGALKRVVREGLERLPYVSSFRPGKMHEGGDGVTVVELGD